MKTYEMLYILDSAIADDAKEAFVAKFEGIVTSMGGKVVSTDKWGVKKLAYPINYKNDGWYALMTFEAEGSVVKELDRVAGLSVEVLRRVITIKA
jgi:small subunit ribosomal protein S6